MPMPNVHHFQPLTRREQLRVVSGIGSSQPGAQPTTDDMTPEADEPQPKESLLVTLGASIALVALVGVVGGAIWWFFAMLERIGSDPLADGGFALGDVIVLPIIFGLAWLLLRIFGK